MPDAIVLDNAQHDLPVRLSRLADLEGTARFGKR
jgi:hypothetical protein